MTIRELVEILLSYPAGMRVLIGYLPPSNEPITEEAYEIDLERDKNPHRSHCLIRTGEKVR